MSLDVGPVWLNKKILLGLNEQILEGTDESPGVRGKDQNRWRKH